MDVGTHRTRGLTESRDRIGTQTRKEKVIQVERQGKNTKNRETVEKSY